MVGVDRGYPVAGAAVADSDYYFSRLHKEITDERNASG